MLKIKKLVILGKQSQLDHRMSLRGKLIARSRGNLLNSAKKSAMFGLDARIALAIFGALSVITGAALYSAIKQSKVVSYVAKSNEIAKALESYVLDTGIDLPDTDTVKELLKTQELLTSSQNGWKGPYLPITDKRTDLEERIVPGGESKTILVGVFSNLTWGGVAGHAGDFENIGCPGKTKCHYWVLTEPYSEDMARSIDIYVDGADTPDTGLVRTKKWGEDLVTLFHYAFPSLSYE